MVRSTSCSWRRRALRPSLPFRIATPALLAAASLLATVTLLGAGPVEAQQSRDEVLEGASTDEGLFDVHRVGDQLLFEIPDDMLGRDMIIMSRFHRVQQGQTNVGANMAPNIVVRWERRDDRVYLRAVSHSNTADPEDNISIAVENQSFAPILKSFEVEARGDGTTIIDVTDLYMGDTPAFSLPSNQRQRLGIRRFDADRSWMEWSKSFPINVEVRVVRT